MCVNRRSKTVVNVVLERDRPATEVHRLHHTPGSKNAQHRVKIWITGISSFIQSICQRFTGGNIQSEALKFGINILSKCLACTLLKTKVQQILLVQKFALML